MDQQLLAERLKFARDAQGITQQQAAEALELPRTAITQIEAGKRAVSTLELTKLAKLYRLEISFFLSEQTSGDNLDKVLYRSNPALVSSSKFKKQIDHFINLCRLGMALEKMLQFQVQFAAPQYSINAPKNKFEASSQGSIVAEQERKRLNLGISPIGDIASLIANQGIWACEAEFIDDVSGLFFKDAKTGTIILVNATQVKSRKRFSFAHEYAHAVLDAKENIRISSIQNNSEFIEVRANAFAAAFLMPYEGVIEALRSLNKGRGSRQQEVIFDSSSGEKLNIEGRALPFSQNITYQDVAIIANYFGVSYQAAVYRFRTLNLISQQESDKLLLNIEDGKSFLKAIKAFDLESHEDKKFWNRELTKELSYLAVEAFRREEISRGKIMEIGDEIGIGGKTLYDFALATLDKNKKPDEAIGSCEVNIEKNVKC